MCAKTFPLMCIFLLAAGLSLLKKNGSTGAKLGPVTLFVFHTRSVRDKTLMALISFIYLFTICYSLGEGPVAFQYSSEVFPTIQREQGMAFAVFINNIFGVSPHRSNKT